VLVGAVVPGEALTIVKVPVDGGEPTTLLTFEKPDKNEYIYELALSPDGTQAAFFRQKERNELWLMEGY
jgi:hypothetical protein